MNEQREGNLPMRHRLKSDPEVFALVLRGIKTAEVRSNDRDFRAGDVVTLCETRFSAEAMRVWGSPLLYTGRELTRQISHVQKGYGLPDGLVVLSFEPEVRVPRWQLRSGESFTIENRSAEPITVNALYDTDPHATVVATGSQVSDVNEAYTRGRAEGFDAAIAWQKNVLQRWAKLAEETKQILEGSLP